MSTQSQKKLIVKLEKKTPNKLAPKDWFTCKDCKENLATEEKILDHCLIMHSQQIFMCSVEKCFKYFKSSNGLHVHCKDFHANVLKCYHCDKICTLYSNLNSHIDAFHVAAKYKCDHCSKSFTRDSDSRRHWNYLCPQNPNRYMHCKHCLQTELDPDVPGAEAGLMNHLIKVHGQSRKFLCLFCHNLFSKQGELDKHKKKCYKHRPQPDLAIVD